MSDLNGEKNSFVGSLLAEAEQLEASFSIPNAEDVEILKNARLDLSKPNPDPTPLITINGLPVCTRGNFSFVIGLPGSRKTFLCTGITGCFLSESGFFGMENATGTGRLLWVDTEQANGHVGRIGKRLHRILNLETNENYDDIVILMLREYHPKDRRRLFESAINYYKPDFIVLDGISDLITDPNNPDQSSEVITFLMAITKRMDCHILTVVHANIGSEKARGHLGSEALRKCETAITVLADGEYSMCKFSKTRDVKPEDFTFIVSDGLPEITVIPDTTRKNEKLNNLMKEVMPCLPETISYSDLCDKIMEFTGTKVDNAKKRIAEALRSGLIVKNYVKRYHLPETKSEEGDDNLPF